MLAAGVRCTAPEDVAEQLIGLQEELGMTHFVDEPVFGTQVIPAVTR
ncbi:MAG TPA: hypothetical protein PKI27_15600 [Dermatophilaceae bacterium]|uniref:Uncharacterized protein n=1 Tax=Candidatus Phosphoribacter hodrii TaxID=2953743 RepID=A0A9D7XWH6_9MICO|nr:hypothetical protein [Candidatus Phosphoribacter hodrii]HOA03733.1 hypothetical protein [Dermatophilaceae bacterium]